MSMFQKWLRMREGFADSGDPVDGFKFDGEDQDFAADHEHVQQELFKTILSKYPEEMMQFLDGIAQRGDSEVASLLSKLKREKKPYTEPQHNTEPDEVVPSGADRGYSGGESGG